MQKATESQRERGLTDLGECEMEKGLNSILVPFFFSAFCAAFCKLRKSFIFPLKWRTQCLNAFKNHHSALGMPQSMNPLKTLFFRELIACVVKAR